MNLVNELQISAEKDDVLTVLRKTKRLASKLRRKDISDWLRWELSGYDDPKAIPDYRKVGVSFAINIQGYVPAGNGMLVTGNEPIPNTGMEDFPMPLGDPIATIQTWIDRGNRNPNHGIFQTLEDGTPITEHLRRRFRIDPRYAGQVSFLARLNDAQVRAIPDQIKDRVLDWACALEEANVTGEGLSFSPEEVATAGTVIFNIKNSYVEQLSNGGTNHR